MRVGDGSAGGVGIWSSHAGRHDSHRKAYRIRQQPDMRCCNAVTRPGAAIGAWIARARSDVRDIDERAGDGPHTKMGICLA
ncbi:hypothetical protein XAXN_19090 [Xanthomonas axonopodis]|uniref:Uncharacterized protein n=1 Tax=Xanthomonas axonopodis TaxID=53413 RepID=A0A0P6VBW7_9XANT|nr:hypothetical protein XAXN_19090 [Xanthomonas axonopodis]